MKVLVGVQMSRQEEQRSAALLCVCRSDGNKSSGAVAGEGLMTGEAEGEGWTEGCVAERSGELSAPLGPGGRNYLGNSHGSNPDH